jgi:hypothetical protein
MPLCCLPVIMATATKQKRSGSSSSNNRVEFAKAVARLKEVNVNFLAIDFDWTLVGVHTGGRWRGTTDELAAHVRDEFRDLFHEAMGQGVRIALVTFSPQQDLIRGVLESFVNEHSDGDAHTAGTRPKIPIRGGDVRSGDLTWEYKGDGSREGKHAHIASAVEELEQEGNIEIAKSTTLLIDDDIRNIKIALEDGVRAVWFNPNRPKDLLRDLLRLV